MTNHPKRPRPQKRTNLGTPCARTWTNDWIATVNAKEAGTQPPNLRRPPPRRHARCTNASDHPSGRCPFHGGFDLTGAPPGNRNHVIHGLYSRRLRPCTPNCPHWENCPLANRHPHPLERGEHGDPSSLQPSTNPQSEDPSSQSQTSDPTDRCDPSHSSQPPNPTPPQQDRHPRDSGDPSSQSDPSNSSDPSYRSHTSYRSYPPNATPTQSPPTCPYQLAEYNTVLTDALAVVESQPHPNPMGIHAAHNVAMLQVLVNAATAHLAQAPNLGSSSEAWPSPPGHGRPARVLPLHPRHGLQAHVLPKTLTPTPSSPSPASCASTATH